MRLWSVGFNPRLAPGWRCRALAPLRSHVPDARVPFSFLATSWWPLCCPVLCALLGTCDWSIWLLHGDHPFTMFHQLLERSGKLHKRLPRNWMRCEDVAAKKKKETQRRLDELSLQQERDPNSASFWLKSEICRTKWIHCQTNGIFTFLIRRATLEHPTHLINFFAISSSRRMPSRDSGLLRGTRNGMGIQENVFEDLPSRERHPSEFFKNSTNFASSSRTLANDSTVNFMEREKEVRREPLKFVYTITLLPKGGRSSKSCRWSLLSHWYDKHIMSQKWILENSQTLWNFRVAKSTSRIKYAKTQRTF